MNSCFVSRAIIFYLINLCMPSELPLSWYKYQLKLPQTGQTYQFFSSLLPSLSEVEKMKQLASPTLLLVSLLLSSIFLQTTAMVGPPVAGPSPPTVPAPPTKPGPMRGFCDSKCEVRCSNAGMRDRCIKYCGICCQRCKCVPSGTYGNKSECPCYRDKLSSQGKPKCP